MFFNKKYLYLLAAIFLLSFAACDEEESRTPTPQESLVQPERFEFPLLGSWFDKASKQDFEVSKKLWGKKDIVLGDDLASKKTEGFVVIQDSTGFYRIDYQYKMDEKTKAEVLYWCESTKQTSKDDAKNLTAADKDDLMKGCSGGKWRDAKRAIELLGAWTKGNRFGNAQFTSSGMQLSTYVFYDVLSDQVDLDGTIEEYNNEDKFLIVQDSNNNKYQVFKWYRKDITHLYLCGSTPTATMPAGNPAAADVNSDDLKTGCYKGAWTLLQPKFPFGRTGWKDSKGDDFASNLEKFNNESIVYYQTGLFPQGNLIGGFVTKTKGKYSFYIYVTSPDKYMTLPTSLRKFSTTLSAGYCQVTTGQDSLDDALSYDLKAINSCQSSGMQSLDLKFTEPNKNGPPLLGALNSVPNVIDGTQWFYGAKIIDQGVKDGKPWVFSSYVEQPQPPSKPPVYKYMLTFFQEKNQALYTCDMPEDTDVIKAFSAINSDDVTLDLATGCKQNAWSLNQPAFNPIGSFVDENIPTHTYSVKQDKIAVELQSSLPKRSYEYEIVEVKDPMHAYVKIDDKYSYVSFVSDTNEPTVLYFCELGNVHRKGSLQSIKDLVDDSSFAKLVDDSNPTDPTSCSGGGWVKLKSDNPYVQKHFPNKPFDYEIKGLPSGLSGYSNVYFSTLSLSHISGFNGSYLIVNKKSVGKNMIMTLYSPRAASELPGYSVYYLTGIDSTGSYKVCPLVTDPAKRKDQATAEKEAEKLVRGSAVDPADDTKGCNGEAWLNVTKI